MTGRRISKRRLALLVGCFALVAPGAASAATINVSTPLVEAAKVRKLKKKLRKLGC